MRERPVVVFIGPPASGKTRVGKRLARRLGVEFTDSDAVIVAEHGPIPALFAEHGETYFREVERRVVHEALGHAGVVSLGGGAIIDPETRDELRDIPVVGLTISLDAVVARIGNDKRPLVTSPETWNELVQRRKALYASVADLTVDTSDRPAAAIVDEIVEWLHSTRKETRA